MYNHIYSANQIKFGSFSYLVYLMDSNDRLVKSVDHIYTNGAITKRELSDLQKKYSKIQLVGEECVDAYDISYIYVVNAHNENDTHKIPILSKNILERIKKQTYDSNTIIYMNQLCAILSLNISTNSCTASVIPIYYNDSDNMYEVIDDENRITLSLDTFEQCESNYEVVIIDKSVINASTRLDKRRIIASSNRYRRNRFI